MYCWGLEQRSNDRNWNTASATYTQSDRQTTLYSANITAPCVKSLLCSSSRCCHSRVKQQHHYINVILQLHEYLTVSNASSSLLIFWRGTKFHLNCQSFVLVLSTAESDSTCQCQRCNIIYVIRSPDDANHLWSTLFWNEATYREYKTCIRYTDHFPYYWLKHHPSHH